MAKETISFLLCDVRVKIQFKVRKTAWAKGHCGGLSVVNVRVLLKP